MGSEFNSMEDLVFSRSFRNWVLNKESPERSFWENWIERNPDKAEMVKYAKAAIYALDLNTTMLSEDGIDEEVRKALIRLREAPRYIPLEGLEGREWRWGVKVRLPRVLVVAVLVAAIGAGGFCYYRAHSHRDALQLFLAGHKSVPEQAADAVADHTFNLPDESLVRLGKNGKLYFSKEWVPDRSPREVFLEGEAYFDIRKNAAAPFYVYTGQVIIRVLGTSFVVHSFPGDVRTIVTDVTGAVSVYRREDFSMRSAGRNAPAGIILTPNQEVVYDRGEDRLHKTLAEMPAPLGKRQDSLLVFQRTPLRQVLGRLQELYGIPIRFDGEAMDTCLLTVTMANKSFYEKLDIICKAIGGAYEVMDGNIVVTAAGCG
jgi:ferric-dicitrate binding protein FerR (iron transport regulator)